MNRERLKKVCLSFSRKKERKCSRNNSSFLNASFCISSKIFCISAAVFPTLALRKWILSARLKNISCRYFVNNVELRLLTNYQEKNLQAAIFSLDMKIYTCSDHQNNLPIDDPAKKLNSKLFQIHNRRS